MFPFLQFSLFINRSGSKSNRPGKLLPGSGDNDGGPKKEWGMVQSVPWAFTQTGKAAANIASAM